MSNTADPAARVATAATQSGVLNRSTTTLIGVFGPEQDMQAMMRMSGGAVRRVKRGASVAGGKVVAIDAKGLILQKGGDTVRLVIPGG